MAESFRVNPSARGQIALHLLGGGKGVGEAAREARRLGISEAVVASPTVPRLVAVDRMNAADVLLVMNISRAGYELVIPGKTVQCMSRGKPILGLMGDCEAASILRRSGLATIVDPDDVAGVTQALLGYLRQRDRLSEVFRPDWEYISGFSRSAMAQRYYDLLVSVAESG
jgi:hypothetical protein